MSQEYETLPNAEPGGRVPPPTGGGAEQAVPPPKGGMSRNTKIILGVLGGMALLCICAVAVGGLALARLGQVAQSSLKEDPAEVATMAEGIADYQLPPGYVGSFGMSLLGFQMVGFSAGENSDRPIYFFMQFPESANLSEEQMERQMQDAMEGQTSRGQNMQVVDQQTVTIRGSEATLTTSEGTDEDNNPLRQALVTFPGKGGTALLMIMGSIDGWEQGEVDDFIASIR